jgi:uncharacterized protein GlcG (DUF336 family)
MDGAWLGVIDVAIKKAKTSALFEMETQIMDNFSKAGADAHGIELTNGHLVTFAGFPSSMAMGQSSAASVCRGNNLLKIMPSLKAVNEHCKARRRG